MGGSGDYDSLKDTLSSLPREVVDEIALARPADGYNTKLTFPLIQSSLALPS